MNINWYNAVARICASIATIIAVIYIYEDNVANATLYLAWAILFTGTLILDKIEKK